MHLKQANKTFIKLSKSSSLQYLEMKLWCFWFKSEFVQRSYLSTYLPTFNGDYTSGLIKVVIVLTSLQPFKMSFTYFTSIRAPHSLGFSSLIACSASVYLCLCLFPEPVSALSSQSSILIGPFHLSAIIHTTVQFYVECVFAGVGCRYVRTYVQLGRTVRAWVWVEPWDWIKQKKPEINGQCMLASLLKQDLHGRGRRLNFTKIGFSVLQFVQFQRSGGFKLCNPWL